MPPIALFKKKQLDKKKRKKKQNKTMWTHLLQKVQKKNTNKILIKVDRKEATYAKEWGAVQV